VELSDNGTDDAGRVIIAATAHKIGQRTYCLGTLQKDCFPFLRQHQRNTLAIPPRHKLVAEFFLGVHRYLEHSRHTLPSHRQQMAGAGYDRVAFWRQ
jgi:hypothetical protein